MAGFYQECIVPTLVDLSMRNKRLVPFRRRVASAAEGRVLEIGIGSGLNLPFYSQNTEQVALRDGSTCPTAVISIALSGKSSKDADFLLSTSIKAICEGRSS